MGGGDGRSSEAMVEDWGSPRAPSRAYSHPMRIAGSVTAVSWIPSEAVTGALYKLPFAAGLAHYDDPPPDVIEDFEAFIAADRCRFVNRLEAWAEVEDGTVVSSGHSGGGLIGSTSLRLGPQSLTFAAFALPDLRRAEALSDAEIRFEQTAGGRTGVPAPRRVSHPPFVQLAAPLAWTTLHLTLRADGSCVGHLQGASPFPRHWIYGNDGELTHKSGTVDFKTWYREAHTDRTPWGDEDSPAVIAAAESAFERELSREVLGGSEKLKRRKLQKGEILVEQDEEGSDVYLLLDGVLEVEVDGERVAEMGPGTMLGERASLEEGKRTATLRALTKSLVAFVPAERLERHDLEALAASRRPAE